MVRKGYMVNKMTVSDFAKLGGKARWKNKTPEERSLQMKRVRKGLSTSKKLDKQVQ